MNRNNKNHQGRLPGNRKPAGSLATTIAACAFCLWAGGLTYPAAAQSDNFNDGNDNGWVRMDPIRQALDFIYGPPQAAYATWSLTNGGYRIQSAESPDPYNLGPSRGGSYWTNASYTYTNFYAGVDVRPWGTNVNQAVGILGRVQDYSANGAAFAYTLTYEPNVQDFQITVFNGGGFAPLTAAKVNLSPTNSHRLVFTGAGDTLEGRIYVLPDVFNPVATVSASDATYSSGWCGLLVFSAGNAATDATYDNYLALPEPPASLAITPAGNAVWVSWSVGLLSYTLQSSAALPATNWTAITNGITQSGGQFIYKTIPSGGAFYRLLMN
jgi:hypothetical protein